MMITHKTTNRLGAVVALLSLSLVTACGASSADSIELGHAGGYVILAKSGIANVSTSAVEGNIAVSPAAATYLTGFALTADSVRSAISSF